MEKLLDIGIDQETLKLIDHAWACMTKNSLKIGDSVLCDISKFNLIFEGARIDNIKIQKIDENEKSRLHSFVIYCKDKGGLAHELCHLVFLCKNKTQEQSNILTDHIIKILKQNSNQSNISFLDIPHLTDFDKLVYYLYLTEEDELIAKLVGHYVKFKTNQKNYHKSKRQSFYFDGRNFEIDDQTIQEIIDSSKQKDIIINYLNQNPPTVIDSAAIKNLVKNINSQCEKYVEKYNLLFNT